MAVAEPLLIDAELSAAPPPPSSERPRMTLEEFHALPDDPALDRELVRGELWETPVSKRNRRHSRTETRIAYLLEQWAETAGDAAGLVYSGEAGVDLPAIDSGFGVDVTYFGPDHVAERDGHLYLTGPPMLAVEIVSPSDRFELLWTKVADYHAAGTPIVWVVDPVWRTVQVHRPDATPQTFAGTEEVTCEPELPGFTTTCDKLFAR